MHDTATHDISTGGILKEGWRNFGRIWGRSVLYAALAFLMLIVLLVVLQMLGFAFEDAHEAFTWSWANFLSNTLSSVIFLWVMFPLLQRLFRLHSAGAEAVRPKLLTKSWMVIALAAAVSGLQLTLEADNGIDMWYLILFLPLSILDTLITAGVLYLALKFWLQSLAAPIDISWRELPVKTTLMLVFILSALTGGVGLLFDWFMELDAGPEAADPVDFAAGMLLGILQMASTLIFAWWALGFTAGLFFAWFRRLPSVQAQADGIRDVFS